MRKLIWIAGLAALAWCGWWWMAAHSLRGAVTTWFDARAAEGWQADLGSLDGGGFPFVLQARLGDIAVADPDAGLAIRTRQLGISAPAWWPGDVTVTLDDGPITLASPFGRSELIMQDGVMALNLHPGTALELEALGWTAGPWRVQGAEGTQMQADTLALTMTQQSGAVYAFEARADEFTPGDLTRASLRLPDSLPRAFDSLIMRATVTFDQPWDRTALDTRRPQPRHIDLHLAEARWGDLRLNFAAKLDVDTDGLATGTLSLQAENWRAMLELAERSQAIAPTLRQQAEGVLQMLANASGNPDSLDVTLSVRSGVIYIGFIPLATAPQLILR